MPNTTNFNWPTPADTDLVKDGAAAIRNLGNGIDTSLIDLKGGTTGQILSKASNADMDFTFITPNVGDITEVQAGTGISVASGTGPIPVVTNSMASEITAAGDIIVGTGSATFDNLPIGTTGQVLTADTTVSPYKVKWAAPSSGGMTLISTTNMSGSSTSLTSIAATYKHLLLVLVDTYGSNDCSLYLRFNSDTTATRYRWTNIRGSTTTLSMGTDFEDDHIDINGVIGANAASLDNLNAHIWVYNYTQTADRVVSGYASGIVAGSQRICSFDGLYTGNGAAISSVQLTAAAGTFSGGSVYLYGVA